MQAFKKFILIIIFNWLHIGVEGQINDYFIPETWNKRNENTEIVIDKFCKNLLQSIEKESLEFSKIGITINVFYCSLEFEHKRKKIKKKANWIKKKILKKIKVINVKQVEINFKGEYYFILSGKTCNDYSGISLSSFYRT